MHLKIKQFTQVVIWKLTTFETVITTRNPAFWRIQYELMVKDYYGYLTA